MKRLHLLLCVLGLSLGACTVQPLYGTFGAGGAPSIGSHLSEIEIAQADSRTAISLRNELIFAFTGGGQAVTNGRYRLDITMEQNVAPSQYEQISGRATTELLYVAANYRLFDKVTKTVVYKSRSFGRASYDRDINRFSNVRALRDGEDRAVRTLAQEMRNSLASYFAQAQS